MINQILAMLNQRNIPQNLGRIKDMMNLVRNANNPQAMINQIASENPQMKQIMDMVGTGDPKQVFLNVCKSKGINPDDVFSMMK